MKKVAAKKFFALGAIALASGSAFAQASTSTSSVRLDGIVDVAYRHTNNEGAGKDGLSKMIDGGMSQSRWGINVDEDLGGGSKALVVLENRLNADDGSVSTPFFQLSYVGLQGPYGRLTAGRQWNVLFDVVTSTYASFPYSPYMEAYKPELGMAMGARTSNMLKYNFATPDRSWVGSLQYSFDENNDTKALEAGLPASAAQVPAYVGSTLGGGAWQTAGGYLRYAANGFAVGGGFMRTTLPGGTDVDAWTLGGSYRTGPWYFSTGYGLNKAKFAAVTSAAQALRKGVDSAVLGAFWAGQTNGGFQPGDADKRQLFKVGVGYQLTPQLNLGAHYFRGKQSGGVKNGGASNGNVNFYVAVADYAFSKRTDAYFGVDHTSISGGSALVLDGSGGNARSRTGVTMGIRHRF